MKLRTVIPLLITLALTGCIKGEASLAHTEIIVPPRTTFEIGKNARATAEQLAGRIAEFGQPKADPKNKDAQVIPIKLKESFWDSFFDFVSSYRILYVLCWGTMIFGIVNIILRLFKKTFIKMWTSVIIFSTGLGLFGVVGLVQLFYYQILITVGIGFVALIGWAYWVHRKEIADTFDDGKRNNSVK